jgi:formylglycine-generating enzyme required for sulfatase activity
VVLLQEIFGVNSHVRHKADECAAAGWLAVAPGLFDRVERGLELPCAEIPRGMACVGAITEDMLLADMQAAIDFAAEVGPVSVIGSCWGASTTATATTTQGCCWRSRCSRPASRSWPRSATRRRGVSVLRRIHHTRRVRHEPDYSWMRMQSRWRGRSMDVRSHSNPRAGRLAFAALCVALLQSGLVPAPAAAAAPASRSFRDCPTCPELVRIAPGRFLMGSTEAEGAASKLRPERAAAERPQHEVRIAAPFAIGRFEVTVGQFAAFAKDSGRDYATCFVLSGGAWKPDPRASWQSPGHDVTPEQPATCLSADDFDAYLAWLSAKTGHRYRFPTEAEWEYVARTGVAEVAVLTPESSAACRQLNAGDASFSAVRGPTWPTLACDDGFAATAPVGRFPANRHGLHDMFGNVAEFVADCFTTSHEGAPVDGSARTDATGCAIRVVKGASWAAEPGSLRPAVRQGIPRNLRGDGHGLRVVREIDAEVQRQ